MFLLLSTTLSQNIRNVWIIQFNKKIVIFADRRVPTTYCRENPHEKRASQPRSDSEMQDVQHAIDAMRKDGSILCSSSSSSRSSCGFLSPALSPAAPAELLPAVPSTGLPARQQQQQQQQRGDHLRLQACPARDPLAFCRPSRRSLHETTLCSADANSSLWNAATLSGAEQHFLGAYLPFLFLTICCSCLYATLLLRRS